MSRASSSRCSAKTNDSKKWREPCLRSSPSERLFPLVISTHPPHGVQIESRRESGNNGCPDAQSELRCTPQPMNQKLQRMGHAGQGDHRGNGSSPCRARLRKRFCDRAVESGCCRAQRQLRQHRAERRMPARNEICKKENRCSEQGAEQRGLPVPASNQMIKGMAQQPGENGPDSRCFGRTVRHEFNGRLIRERRELILNSREATSSAGSTVSISNEFISGH